MGTASGPWLQAPCLRRRCRAALRSAAVPLLSLLLLPRLAAAEPGIGSPRFKKGIDLHLVVPDTRGELDDWNIVEPGDSGSHIVQHLAVFMVLGLLGVGAWVRSQKLLVRETADRLRRLCFNWLLPAFLLRHIWLCDLDRKLFVVAAWSLVFHSLWSFLSLRAAHALEPKDRQMRGWTMLLGQGAMNSFLYPLLLRNEKFGEKALACAVLWDLGGNMWICQFALFAIAAFFRPGSREPMGSAMPEGLQLGDGMDLDEFAEEEDREHLIAKPNSPTKAALQALSGVFPREILVDALKQPVLVCCVLGFLFNVTGAPLPYIVDGPLWILGEPYKLALYFLVGFYGDHRIGANDLRRIGFALGVRYSISSVIIVTVLLTLPLEPLYRYTIALALLSPTSSYCMHLIGEHGYGEGLLRLTVCAGFVSTLVSTFGQNMLMAIFTSWLPADR